VVEIYSPACDVGPFICNRFFFPAIDATGRLGQAMRAKLFYTTYPVARLLS